MFIFCAYVRANFKLTKKRDEKFWLSIPDKANSEAHDSENGKLNYSYADLKNYYRKTFLKVWKLSWNEKNKNNKFEQK